MVDLSKPLERIKQAIDRRNYELALTLALECQEVSPTTVELYQLLLDAAKKRAKEGGKSPFSLGLSFGGDAFKKFGSAVKKVALKMLMVQVYIAVFGNRKTNDILLWLYNTKPISLNGL